MTLAPIFSFLYGVHLNSAHMKHGISALAVPKDMIKLHENMGWGGSLLEVEDKPSRYVRAALAH